MPVITFEKNDKVMFRGGGAVGVVLDVGREVVYVDWGRCTRKERKFNLVIVRIQ